MKNKKKKKKEQKKKKKKGRKPDLKRTYSERKNCTNRAGPLAVAVSL